MEDNELKEFVIQRKIIEIDNRMKYKSLEKVVNSYYYNYFNKLILESDDVESFLPLFKEIKEELKNKKENGNYMFINVNPASNISLFSFLKIIDKFIKRKYILDYLYVLEQRGESLEELGKGFHLHMIIKKKESKSFNTLTKDAGMVFNPMCDTSNYHFFNTQYIKECDMEKRRNYIIGRKADPKKHLKQDMDIIWRKENNIKSYYGNIEIGLIPENN